jgi:hypothetical protein
MENSKSLETFQWGEIVEKNRPSIQDASRCYRSQGDDAHANEDELREGRSYHVFEDEDNDSWGKESRRWIMLAVWRCSLFYRTVTWLADAAKIVRR